MMTCQALAERLQSLQPDLPAVDVARICVMILSQCKDPSELEDEAALVRIWKHCTFRLEAAADQHAAVAEEMDELTLGGPIEFSPDQLWTLLRAVKVQSQILELYTETPAFA